MRKSPGSTTLVVDENKLASRLNRLWSTKQKQNIKTIFILHALLQCSRRHADESWVLHVLLVC